MNKVSSYKVSEGLFLVRQFLDTKAVAKAVDIPTNHVICVDVSGSMYSELPKIREQLKKKLPKILKEKDTVSVIWFSGRGEFGTLLEAEPVASLADLKDVNSAIDRWIKTVGLTGFKEPIEEVGRLVERVSKKTPGVAFSLFFMSDGCDNQWQKAEILKAVEKTAGGLSAATFVEYGYYADRPLLTAMAEKAGGALIFAQDFDKYAPQFEAAMSKGNLSAKKVEVKIQGDVIGGFAFALQGSDLLTFAVEGDKVTVPEGLTEVCYVSPKASGTNASKLSLEAIAGNIGGDYDGRVESEDLGALNAAYGAVSLFSVRMKSDVVFPFLRALGDVTFIESFANCFGKQKYSDFMDSAKTAAFDSKARFIKGFDPKKVPRDDAFTVLQLLQVLSKDDENRVLLDHPDFKYNRIGRGRIDSSTILTDDEQAEIEKLTLEMTSNIKDVKKVKEVTAKIEAITNKKGDALKFVENNPADGYSISNLVYNEDRPNISIQIRKEGAVDISSRLPAEFKGTTLGKVPENFQSFVFRNYTMIKDGLVNVEKLPVHISEATFNTLAKEGVVTGSYTPSEVTVLDVKSLPIINRKMVSTASAKALFNLEWDLTKARAAQKVYNSFKKEKIAAKESKTFDAIYGAEAGVWLKEQGFTDYSGFAPKSVQAPAVDKYMAKELAVAIKGYSSIPSLGEFRKQASKSKFNGPGELMKPAVAECEAFLASDVYTNAASKDDLFATWIEGKCKNATMQVRSLLAQMAQIKFAVVVGQSWFSEFASLDESSLEMTFDGTKIPCTVTMKEVEEAV